MPQIFTEDSGNLKHPKKVKIINNNTGSHLVSCRVIPRPATVKGVRKRGVLENTCSWKSKM